MSRKKSDAVKRREDLMDAFRQLEPVGQVFALRYVEKLLELQQLEEIVNKVDANRASGKEACSFCGKDKEAVHRLLAGPADVYICDNCVKLCAELIADDERASQNE